MGLWYEHTSCPLPHNKFQPASVHASLRFSALTGPDSGTVLGHDGGRRRDSGDDESARKANGGAA